ALQAKGLSIREFELEIWRYTNIERARYGISPLNYDENLADLAKLHTKNMIDKKFFAHIDHLGDAVAQRKTKYQPNLIVSSIGENLGKFINSAKTFSPQECVTGWMNSPDHRKNILDPDYTHMGVGII
ncbi:MAG TPA: CAP domain-containing protein, partial [Candidatus Cloacimonadota bacterium]|nr:CAP domain-containing protein [Candidatus Cloacimonadota bacterium]